VFDPKLKPAVVTNNKKAHPSGELFYYGDGGKD
jgi:hypothetical protein